MPVHRLIVLCTTRKALQLVDTHRAVNWRLPPNELCQRSVVANHRAARPRGVGVDAGFCSTAQQLLRKVLHQRHQGRVCEQQLQQLPPRRCIPGLLHHFCVQQQQLQHQVAV